MTTLPAVLRRRPLYPILVMSLVALGIGAATAMLAVLDATILHPLPYRDSGDLYAIWGADSASTDAASTQAPLSAIQLVRWRESTRLFDGIGGLTPARIQLTGAGDPESLKGSRVSAGLFTLLGVAPQRGRDFTAQEEAPASGVAIISDGLWTRRFNRDPSVLGRTLVLDDEPRLVIGIMPPGFAPLLAPADVWVPLPVGPALLGLKNLRNLLGVGRLRAGRSPGDAAADLDLVSRQLGQEMPQIYGNTRASVVPLDASLYGSVRPQVVALLLAVTMLVLIAGANLANLTLADSMARRNETMTRVALGAGRGRIAVRRLLTSALLALTGGIAGVALGRAGLLVLQRINPDVFAGFGVVGINPIVILLALVAAVVLGLVAGAPAAVADASTEISSIAGTGVKSTGDRADRRIREGLVMAQVALAVILTVAAGLLARDVGRLLARSPGFQPENVLVLPLTLSPQKYPTPADRANYVERLVDAIHRIPGVEDAATIQTRFELNATMQTLFEIEGRPAPPGRDELANIRHASADIFRTLRISVLEGRGFEHTDRADGLPVVVVSRTFARKYWPTESALGKRLRRSGRAEAPWLEVVGVVEDVMDAGVGQLLGPTLYICYSQMNTATAQVTAVVRSRISPATLAPAVRDAIWSVDRTQAVETMDDLPNLLLRSAAGPRFQALVVRFFAGSALILVLSGIYATTLYGLSRRTREIGVRAALGASPRELLRFLMRESLGSVVVGTVVGLLAVAWGTTALRRILTQGVTGEDLPLIVALVIGMLLAAVVAAMVPARRAVRSSLSTLLRA